jgi:beta-carotene 3-hydroxylase
MNWLIYFMAAAGAFLLMEYVAWVAHKYVMHGWLWRLHKDHHDGSYHPFQKNDAFFLIFAIPCWLCTMLGSMYEVWWVVAFGVGIFLYGVCYFLVHDVIIHQRFKWFTHSNNRYIKVIRWAHKMHHKHREKGAGESFGLLIVPRRYWQKIREDERRAAQNRRIVHA